MKQKKKGEHFWKLKCHPYVKNTFENIIVATIGERDFPQRPGS